ncbi:hypothetical protein [Escherichia coli]|nr:hypothetical protein [Escherichia coli]
MMHETNISPLLMAWSIAAVLRIACDGGNPSTNRITLY